MSVKVEKKENSKVELEFVVEAAEFDKALDIAFKQNQKHFKVQGFRAGKVPRNVVEKTYGEGILYEDAFNIVAEKVFSEAVLENKLEVVARPEVEIKEIGKGKDLVFTATVYVKPEVKVKAYKGLSVERPAVKVTAAEVKEEIEKVRERNARIEVVTRKVKKGDIANIDFEGFKDGVAFEGGKAEGYDLEIGSGAFIPGFEEQIIGMKTSEEKDIEVTFPEEYHQKDLAGAPVVFKIKVNQVSEKKLPTVDDEFAKDVSEFDTLEEYKASIEKNLKESKENLADREVEVKVMDALVDNVEVDLPEPMIEDEMNRMVEDAKANLAQQGITLEQYLEITNTKMEDFKNQFRDGAVKNLKITLALEVINKEEKIEVTDEDIDAKIEYLAAQFGKEAESFKNNANVRAYVASNLKNEKVLTFLVENAKVKKATTKKATTAKKETAEKKTTTKKAAAKKEDK